MAAVGLHCAADRIIWRQRRNYTTDRLIKDRPNEAAGAVRALVAAQKALRADVTLAAKVGAALFPGETEHIVTLVRRDLPYYEANLTPEFIAGMNRFARSLAILDIDVPYSSVVASQFSDLWQ